MAKRFLCLIFFFLMVFSPAFASAFIIKKAFQGPYALKTIGTEHFDFIYPLELEETAVHLSEHVEDIYDDMVSYFGSPWNMERMSIVLTPDSKSLNAYYSPYTASHVILYVTQVDEGDLTNYDDVMLSVLEHELVHAYSMKLHSGAMQGASIFFGDYFCNGIFLPNMIIEGLAVAFESRNGAGRLNNPFVTSVLRQAMHEQKFPEWRDLIGGMSSYPHTQFEYIAGGAFIHFIRTEYGVEKFYEFIREMHSMFSFPALFERVYDMKLEDAWRSFIAKLIYPQDIIFPKPFVREPGKYYNLQYKNGSFYWADIIQDEMYKYSLEGIKTIASIDGIFNSFAVADDASLFAYTAARNTGSVAEIYEESTGKLLFSMEDVRHVGFASVDGQNVVVLEENVGTRNNIILVNTNKEVIWRFPLPENTDALAFTSFSKNMFALILRDGIYTRLGIANVKENKIDIYSIDNNIIQGITARQNQSNKHIFISLSVAERKGVFEASGYPTLLVMEFTEEGKFVSAFKGKNEIDGGVFYPVLLNNEVYFVSRRFRNDYLSSIDYAALESESVDVTHLRTLKPEDAEKNEVEDTGAIVDIKVDKSLTAKSYSRFVSALPFANRGALIPFIDYDRRTGDVGTFAALSYFTADPTESIMSSLTFSYNAQPFVYGKKPNLFETNLMSFELGFEVDVLPVDFYVGIRPEIYVDKTTGLSVYTDFFLVADYTKYLNSNKNYIKSSLILGLDKRFKGSLVTDRDGLYGSAAFSYNSLIASGYGHREYKGWRVGAKVSMADTERAKRLHLESLIYGDFYIPSILPFNNLPEVTFNFPLNISLLGGYNKNGELSNVKAATTKYDHLFLASLKFDFVLVSFDVEKIISRYFPFIFSRLSIDFDTQFTYNRAILPSLSYHLLDIKVGVEVYATFAAAFLGVAVSEGKVDLGIRYEMNWRSNTTNNNSFYPIPQSKWGTITLLWKINSVL